MRALQIDRHVHRFAAARVASLIGGSGTGVGVGPLHLTEAEPLALPSDSWQRCRPVLSGICGSDLATIDGASSRYFESIVSFPFILGHEIVGELLDGPRAGERIVVEPVLGCAARGIVPPCTACASGRRGSCERIAYGHLRPGLQTGYCADTGGGWSEELIVHDSQIHSVPEGFSDEAAVIVEPTACAIHGALRGRISAGEQVVVLGSGTLGLLTIAAIRRHCLPSSLCAVAKYRNQADFARAFGADLVVEPDEIARAVRRITGTLALKSTASKIEQLAGGADVVFDCVGSSRSLEQALSVVRPGGRIVLIGMPANVRIDLAPLWQREIEILGAYAYGTEDLDGEPRSTFELAFELVAAAGLERLISASYPLERYEEAVRHAANAGRRGAVKIVFDLGRDTEPSWRRPVDAAAAPKSRQKTEGEERT